MAFTIVQSVIGTRTTNGTSAATLNGVLATSQLIAIPVAQSSATFSLSTFVDSVDTLTNPLPYVVSSVSSFLGSGLYFDAAPTAGSHTVTATYSGAVNSLVLFAEVNAGSAMSLDLAGSVLTGTSTAFATNSVTTTQDGDVVIAVGNISQSTETLSAWGSFTQAQFYNSAIPSGVWAYYVQPTKGAVSAGATISVSSHWQGQIVAFKVGPATTPTITSVNTTNTVAEGATAVPVVGTNFDNTATVAITQPGVNVAQTGVVYNSATSLSFNLVVEPGAGNQLAFTDATYTTDITVTTTTGGTSTPFALTVTPPAGNIFQTLASINGTSAYDITAIPALAISDQLEASGNATGTAAAPAGLTLYSDSTYGFGAGYTPADFWVRAYDGVTKTWGAWALQSVSTFTAQFGVGFGGVARNLTYGGSPLFYGVSGAYVSRPSGASARTN